MDVSARQERFKTLGGLTLSSKLAGAGVVVTEVPSTSTTDERVAGCDDAGTARGRDRVVASRSERAGKERSVELTSRERWSYGDSRRQDGHPLERTPNENPFARVEDLLERPTPLVYNAQVQTGSASLPFEGAEPGDALDEVRVGVDGLDRRYLADRECSERREARADGRRGEELSTLLERQSVDYRSLRRLCSRLSILRIGVGRRGRWREGERQSLVESVVDLLELLVGQSVESLRRGESVVPQLDSLEVGAQGESTRVEDLVAGLALAVAGESEMGDGPSDLGQQKRSFSPGRCLGVVSGSELERKLGEIWKLRRGRLVGRVKERRWFDDGEEDVVALVEVVASDVEGPESRREREDTGCRVAVPEGTEREGVRNASNLRAT